MTSSTSATNLATILATKWRLQKISLLGMELWRFYWNFPCDITACRKGYKYRAANEGRLSLWSFVSSMS
ncbi:hypothetical protein AVEN_205785-1, partial [Araneus ventricosus]